MTTDQPQRETYDLGDLIEAQFAAEGWGDSTGEMAEHSRSWHRAMAAAFAATPETWMEPVPTYSSDCSWLFELAAKEYGPLHRVDSLGSGWLEEPGGYTPRIGELQGAVDDAVRLARVRLMELLVHMFAKMRGIAIDARVTDDDLLAHGYVPPVKVDPDWDESDHL